jgi:hypothetical protein
VPENRSKEVWPEGEQWSVEASALSGGSGSATVSMAERQFSRCKLDD